MESAQSGAKPNPSFQSPVLKANSHGSSPLRTSVGAKEREKLTASIHSLNNGRLPIDLSSLLESETTGQLPHPPETVLQIPENLISSAKACVAARDRDKALGPTAPNTSRPASPYTLNPPIDFDGLSWPSELRSRFSLES